MAETPVSDWPGQERLAALAELSIDAAVLVNGAGIITWSNRSIENVLGFAPDDLLGMRAGDLVAADDRTAWRAFADELLQTPDVPRTGTFRCRHKDGSTRWLYGTARNLLTETRVGAIIVYLRDITPSREAEAAFRATEARYRQLFDDATDVVFETDNEGYFRLVNPATLRVFGYEQSEVIGRRFTEFIRTDHRQTVFEHYRKQTDNRERASYIEFPAVTRDGREIWLGQNAWIFADPSGQFGGMRAVARDITERRRADEALRQAQKMEAVGRLAGGIAHDFNNLLTAIRGNAELLSHKLRSDPDRAAEVEEILHASDRAASLTSQLLAFSRKQDIAPVTLDINEVVEGVARLSRRLIGPSVALEIQTASALQSVVADPAQVEQLLLNLILNARDALPNGGHVTVRTANRQLPDGTPEGARTGLLAGAYVRMQVIDDGIGMDAATQARLFEPFFTTKEPGRGTGLGLSTVYGIVRQMGGVIIVASELNQGTTFSVYLPSAADRAAGSSAEPSRQEA
ncbi:MAG TPA: PAS domain S-box protein [Vicinamibacterales bacterium]|nr:PAS domain S-box protein [Vicinamibacterales bacterium]